MNDDKSIWLGKSLKKKQKGDDTERKLLRKEDI